MIWVIIINALVWFLMFAYVRPRIVQRKRAAVARRPPQALNYYQIGRLEIDLFGETKPNADSPVKPYQKNVYGVSEDGHLDGECNVNASIGPVCHNKWHTGRRVQPSPGYGLPLYAYGYALPVSNPYGDRGYDDPTWTDEDGRPW